MPDLRKFLDFFIFWETSVFHTHEVQEHDWFSLTFWNVITVCSPYLYSWGTMGFCFSTFCLLNFFLPNVVLHLSFWSELKVWSCKTFKTHVNKTRRQKEDRLWSITLLLNLDCETHGTGLPYIQKIIENT